jgi:hypothetical protein
MIHLRGQVPVSLRYRLLSRIFLNSVPVIVPELVFTKLILLVFYIGFMKLIFTVASLYWNYPVPTQRFVKSLLHFVFPFGGKLFIFLVSLTV